MHISCHNGSPLTANYAERIIRAFPRSTQTLESSYSQIREKNHAKTTHTQTLHIGCALRRSNDCFVSSRLGSEGRGVLC